MILLDSAFNSHDFNAFRIPEKYLFDPRLVDVAGVAAPDSEKRKVA